MSDEFDQLNYVLSRRTLALFLGSDLPQQITGLPSRADLARELSRRRGLDDTFSIAEVAQRIGRGDNRWDLVAYIRDQLDTTGKQPQPIHRFLVDLVQIHQIGYLITTAYDDLVDLAFQEAGVPVNLVVRNSDVRFIVPGRPTLIKLYGDVRRPDTLVITEDDQYQLWRNRDKEDLLDEVHTILRRNTVLFLGYNLSDPCFRFLWQETQDRAGRFACPSYAVWSGITKEDRQLWRGRGVTILDEAPLHVLDKLVMLAAPSGHSKPQSQASPSGLVSPQSTVKAMGEWDTGAIRQLLTEALDDQEVVALCFDHFRPVYDDLSDGMSKGRKIQLLLDYCVRKEQIGLLLERVKDHNPVKYDRFAPDLCLSSMN
jgi:hypothetical protein